MTVFRLVASDVLMAQYLRQQKEHYVLGLFNHFRLLCTYTLEYLYKYICEKSNTITYKIVLLVVFALC